MVVPTCIEYKAGSHYLNGGTPFGHLTRQNFWFVNSVTYLYFEYLSLFHACFFKECHILWHSDLQFKKWQDVPPNLHVDWRKISFWSKPELLQFINFGFIIFKDSMPIILDKGHFQACLSIVFILCTYMIFWPCNVKNGCTYLHRVQSWVTLPQWRKPIWTSY